MQENVSRMNISAAIIVCIRVLSLAVLLILFWYIMVAPSLEVKQDTIKEFRTRWSSLDSLNKEQAKELARFDLEKKVYPEIQDRLTKVNDWLITKVVFA